MLKISLGYTLDFDAGLSVKKKEVKRWKKLDLSGVGRDLSCQVAPKAFSDKLAAYRYRTGDLVDIRVVSLELQEADDDVRSV